MVDYISELPEQLIHHIISFLHWTDAFKISVLSTQFRSAILSSPIIDFDEANNSEQSDIDTLLHNFPDFLRRRAPGIALQRFRFCAPLKYCKSDVRFDSGIKYALENFVKEFHLDVSYCKVANFIFYNYPVGDVFSDSITILKLKGFSLRTLRCPALRNLSLHVCQIETLKIVSDKLKTMEVVNCEKLESVEVVDPNLESFKCGIKPANKFKPFEMSISACTSLKSITLSNVNCITDHWITSHISDVQFPFLEKLSLCDCNSLKRFKILHSKLKIFELFIVRYVDLEKVEIDARNLDVFRYSITYEWNIKPTSLVIYSPRVKVELLILDSYCNDESSKWLRRLLSYVGHCRELNLSCTFQDLMVPIDRKNKLVSPMHDLKHLKVTVDYSISKLIHLINNLLWLAPHPDSIYLLNSSGTRPKSLKFQYHTARSIEDEEEEDAPCAHCHLMPKCWRHDLKEVTMENFGYEEIRVLQQFIETQVIQEPTKNIFNSYFIF